MAKLIGIRGASESESALKDTAISTKLAPPALKSSSLTTTCSPWASSRTFKQRKGVSKGGTHLQACTLTLQRSILESNPKCTHPNAPHKVAVVEVGPLRCTHPNAPDAVAVVEVRPLRVHQQLHSSMVEAGTGGGDIWWGRVLRDGLKKVCIFGRQEVPEPGGRKRAPKGKCGTV
eukprot:1150328-Pelagomonas_calceolata.AAC.5